jgi:murein DD-endopeptidase MepM/ murein hydrolase activator NlpD
VSDPRRKQRAFFAVIAFATLGAATAFSFAPPSLNADAPVQSTVIEQVGLEQPLIGASDHGVFYRQERIQRGDTLALVVQRLDGQDPAFLAFARKDKAARQLLQMNPGRSVAAEIDADGRVLRFWTLTEPLDKSVPGQKGAAGESALDERPLPSARRLLIARSSGAQQDPASAGRVNAKSTSEFIAREEEVRIDRTLEMRGFEIRSTLFSATDEAGIPDPVATQVAEILGGEVDFHRDLRRGDSVRVVWESLQIADGLEAPMAGRVLAVEMVHGKRKLQAFWFDRGNGRGGYYTPQGKSLKKSFLSSPLEYSRISSGFSEMRMHPIHHEWRAHRGIDYAAPTGTRVRAVADGVIESVGGKSGYGNVITVKHANNTVSLYAHLSAFGPGLRQGSRISQGDTLGYVGSTGWSTGPHLHFEFMIAGAHVDPLRAAIPATAMTLSGTDQSSFRSQVLGHQRRIALLSTPRLARFE